MTGSAPVMRSWWTLCSVAGLQICLLFTGFRTPPPDVTDLKVRIVKTYPHDTSAFTQGLIWYQGKVYESTGQYGHSSLRQVDLKTGDILHRKRLPAQVFGEGLARIEDRLVQLTWRKGVAFVYKFPPFERVGEIQYRGQGWGLCYDGSWLIMSDGSNVLTLRDPSTMAVWRRLPVTMHGRPVRLLNELEWVEGEIYANIWQETRIVRINPQTGRVNARIDASSLPYQPRTPGEDVLNGIAYVPERGTFLLTGKLWPSLFEVKFE